MVGGPGPTNPDNGVPIIGKPNAEEAVVYHTDVTHAKRIETCQPYLMVFSLQDDDKKIAAAILIHRRASARVLYRRLQQAGIINDQLLDQLGATESRLFGKIIELIRDDDFDGHFDFDFPNLCKLLGHNESAEKMALVWSAVLTGDQNGFTRYFSEISDPYNPHPNSAVVAYVAQNGWPWDSYVTRDGSKELATQLLARTSQNPPPSFMPNPSEVTNYEFFASVRAPYTMDKTLTYLSEKYEGRLIFTDDRGQAHLNQALAKEFLREIEMIKRCTLAYSKEWVNHEQKDVTVNDEFTLTAENMPRLSTANYVDAEGNNYPRSRTDCGGFAQWEMQAFEAVGLVGFMYLSERVSAESGHATAVGLIPGTFYEEDGFLYINADAEPVYFASNNFHTYLITGNQMYGGKLSEDGQAIAHPKDTQEAVKMAVSLSARNIPLNQIRIYGISQTISELAEIPEEIKQDPEYRFVRFAFTGRAPVAAYQEIISKVQSGASIYEIYEYVQSNLRRFVSRHSMPNTPEAYKRTVIDVLVSLQLGLERGVRRLEDAYATYSQNPGQVTFPINVPLATSPTTQADGPIPGNYWHIENPEELQATIAKYRVLIEELDSRILYIQTAELSLLPPPPQ